MDLEFVHTFNTKWMEIHLKENILGMDEIFTIGMNHALAHFSDNLWNENFFGF